MTAETATFELPPTMKIDDCKALFAFLHAAQDKPVAIDCTRVTRLSGLGAQLLVIGMRIWTNKDVAFGLTEPSEEFVQCMNDLGLADQLSQQAVQG